MNKVITLRTFCPYCPEAKIGALIANLRIFPGEKLHIVDTKHPTLQVREMLYRIFGKDRYTPTSIISRNEVVERFDSLFIRKKNILITVGVFDFLHFYNLVKSLKVI